MTPHKPSITIAYGATAGRESSPKTEFAMSDCRRLSLSVVFPCSAFSSFASLKSSPRFGVLVPGLVVLASLLLPLAARAQTITAGGAINFTASDVSAQSSTVTVSGAPGPVATVKVTLQGVQSNGNGNYESIGYAEFMLQSPSGEQFVLLSATGDGIDYGGLTGVNIVIQDGASAAPAFIPWTDVSQTVEASSYFMDNFVTPPPLPAAENTSDYPQTDGSATLNGKFNGVTANGTWTLYLIDVDTPVDPVSITGWTLTLTYGTGTSTTTVLSSSSNPAYYANSASSASITYTATVTSGSGTPTGTVTFQANGATISGCNAVALSSGVAHCTTSLAQGNYGIAAQYSPTGVYGQSSGSTEQLVEVTPANPSGDQWCNNSVVSDPASDNVGLVYPSIIGISDSSYNGKTVGNVTVALEGLQGTAGIAGQYLLVAPGGGTKNLVFLQEGWFNDSGSTSAVNLTFDDAASVTVPYNSGTPATGTYLPTDNNEAANLDTFQTSISPSVDSTVPQVPGTLNFAPPYGSDTAHYAHTNVLTFGEAFNGASANGKWALYSVSPGATTLNDGWCITLALNTGVATTTTLTPTSGNPATTGQPVTITASVNDINGGVTGGTVTFLDNGVAPAGTVSGNNVVSVIGGAATFTTSSLTEGDHSITASYSGVTNVDNPSYSSALYQRINTATTSANVNSNTWSYCNPGAVQIQSGSLAGPFTPNPSVISVTNLPGTLNSVSVTLKGFSVLTTYGLEELASLVEGPTGAALDFFSNTTQGASGNGEASLGTYTFEDSASSLVSAGNTSITPGDYKPTAYINYLSTPDVFTSSLSGFYNVPSFSYAPSHGSSTFANIFTDGSNANGNWSLFFSSGNANATFGAANGWCVNLTENLPTVTVSASHSGNFTQGQLGASLTVGIENSGANGPTGDPSGTNPMTVTDTLNSAFTYAGYSGTNWSCSAASQTVTCTNDSAIAQGSSYPTLTINVNVADAATGPINNGASASGAGVTSTNSNTDSITINTTPKITGVSPNSGPTAGGTNVTITGTNFTGATGVTIGGAAATSVVVVSSTTITAVTPAGTAGTASVIVTTSGGSNATNTLFTYVAPPTVTAGATVTFVVGGSPVALDSGLTVSTSTSTVTGATVSIASGPSADQLNFTSQNGITGSFNAGTLTLTGTATVAAYQVALESVTFSTTSTSVIPRTINWTVTNSFASSAPATSTVYILLPPTVNSISPTSGPSAGGTSVTITGTNFTGATGVTIGGAAATSFVVVNNTSITAVTPAGTPGTASVVVTTSGGSNSANSLFTYVAPPTVNSISPTSGPTAGGTSVTITGTNFTGATGVTFGGAAATSFVVVSDTTIVATTPARTPGAASVVVTTSGGSNAASTLFTFVAPPTVNSISPTSGPLAGGTSVTITGTNFTGATSVIIGGAAATSVVVVSNTTIIATTPAGTPGTASVVVTTSGGSNSANTLFTYVAPPTVSGISPSFGLTTGGTIVTITGTNLLGATGVQFGSTSATITPGSSTQIVATAPVGSGTVDVTVTTPGGTSAASSADQFTYIAPVATSLTPTVTPSSTFVYSLQPSISVALSPSNATGIAVSDFTALLDNSTVLTVTAGTGNNFNIALPVTPLTVGAHSITVSFAGAIGYLASNTTIALTVTTPTLVVNTAQDDLGSAANCTPQVMPGTNTVDAACSLRDALLLAASAGSGNISFDSTKFAATNSASQNTITVSYGTFNIPSNTTITGATSGSGATLTNLVTVNGAGAWTVFAVGSGVTGAALNNLTITNGHSNEIGGGINNSGTLTVSNSTVSGNTATGAGGSGGGIYNSGTLIVTNSTFGGNIADNSGGGIYNAGTLTVTDSTFSGNSTPIGAGGGIYNAFSLAVSNSTFSGNIAAYGPGIDNMQELYFANTLSADLWAFPSITAADLGGNVIAGRSGVLASSIKLSALGNYGGPTQTMLLLPGSNGICSGTATPSAGPILLPSTDQRGFGFVSTYCPTGHVDAGAVQTNYGMSFTTEPPASISTNVLFSAPNIPAVTLTESGSTATYASSTVSASSGLGAVTLNGTTSTTLSAGVGSFSGLTLSSTTSQSGESLTATINLNGSLNLTATSNPFNVIVITLSPTSLNSGTVASFYSQQITASNGTAPYTYSVGAGLPAGLTLTSSGVDAGLLSGIPTAGGTFNFTITATDNLGNSGSQAYTLVVGAPTIIVSPATLASGTYGTSYNQSVSASGGTASYTYALAGGSSLPPGLSLSSSGAITGTPSQASATAYTFTIIATDSSSGTGPYTGSKLVSLTINQANATILVTPYVVTYDGTAHTAAGTATGAGGVNLAADLNLGGTTHTNAGSYANDGWSFTDLTGNYASASGTVSDKINQANATINITPYTVTYDTTAHTATGTATGAGGVNLAADLNLGGTTHTNAGSYANDGWSFTDLTGNYSSTSGTVSDKINQANATINITPYTVTYDGAAHTATGTATGVGGVNLAAGLSLSSTTHTSGGTYAADGWSFTDPTGNYASTSGTITDTINRAASAVVLATSLNPTLLQNPVTYTSTVSSKTGMPTGTVTFEDGGVALTACTGVPVTVSTGLATCAVTYTVTGTHNIIAVYSGDTNFLGAGPSNTVSEAAIDINFGTTNTSETILPGGAAAYSFSVAPSSGTNFPSPVTFTVSASPALPSGTTMTLTPSAWVFNSNNPWSWTLPANTSLTSNTVLTIQLPQATAFSQPAGGNLVSRLAPFSLALFLLPFASRMRKSGKRFGRMLMVVLLAGAGAATLAGLSGCGSNTGFFAQSPQSYTVTETVSSGSLSYTSNVTLTVE
jgi:hypothetical protein